MNKTNPNLSAETPTEKEVKVDPNEGDVSPPSEKDLLLKEIANWQEQYSKALNTAAHHENLSKIYRADYERSQKYRSQTLVEKLLPVLDSFQIAFQMPASPEAENYRVGFDYIFQMIKRVLESEGVTEIIPKIGDTYDTNLHQATETIEVEDPKLDGKIGAVKLNGYRFKDRVIRVANVTLQILKKVKPQSEPTPTDVKNTEATAKKEA